MGSYKPVNAVMRGLEVLTAVNKLKGRATVGELHRETALDKATIVRMLETLMHAGLVVRDADRTVYEVTGKTLLLCAGYDRHRAVGRVVAPIIASFRNRFGWPSDVAICDHDAMVLIESSRESGPIVVNRLPGYRAPMLGTSLGLAYLAFASGEERDDVLDRVTAMPAVWNEIARDRAKAERYLADIRAQGYATMHDEYSRTEYGRRISTIGVPILVDGVSMAAMNVLYLKNALSADEAVKTMLAPLEACAAEIAEALTAGPG
ncbi:MAG: IclR family transcriptional regulator [Rhodospirillales bacterium CG15_BIG_FIL_POST_REV_8_21_14_020_66_15]|nr:MAG: IclR family transcriptional regulator [Rhodospirillales bacterium CG15_BIG_FIL_POST_REV_8_21_14_020_66_15]